MSEQIQVNLGGNVQDFVNALSQAVNAEKSLEGQAKKTKLALGEQSKAHDKSSVSANKNINSLRGVKKETGDVGRLVNSTIAPIKAFIGAWVGLNGIQRLVESLAPNAQSVGKVDRMIELLQELVDRQGQSGPSSFSGVR